MHELAQSPLPESDGSETATSGTHPDECDFIRATLAGETQAFGNIVRTHNRRVYNFIYQMTRHRQDAEDLTQQTFLNAYNHLARFDLRRPLIAWLLTIARNLVLNHFRDARRWGELPAAEPIGSEPSPARSAEMQDGARHLWERARAALSPREFEILWLRFAEELSVEETARVVGLTQTHVKVLVFRARKTLLKGQA